MESTIVSSIHDEIMNFEDAEEAELASVRKVWQDTQLILSAENKSSKTSNEMEKQRLDLEFSENNLLKYLDFHYAALVDQSRRIEIENLGISAQILEKKVNSEEFSKRSLKEIADHKIQLESDEAKLREDLQESITNQKGQLSIKRKLLKALEDKAEILVKNNKYKYVVQDRFPKSEQWFKLNEEYQAIKAQLEQKREAIQPETVFSDSSTSTPSISPYQSPKIQNSRQPRPTYSKSYFNSQSSISMMRATENQSSNDDGFGFGMTKKPEKKVTLQTNKPQLRKMRYG